MDESISSLGKADVFSTLNLNNGYWQIEIQKLDRDEVAFTSQYETNQFIYMPFGLRNGRGTFQRTMVVRRAVVKWQFALVYLKKVVVFPKTPEETIRNNKEVLKLLNNVGVTVKIKKFGLFTSAF